MTTQVEQRAEDSSGPPERRSWQRYPLHMLLSGRFLTRWEGSVAGETVNLSSHGILFAAENAIPINAQIELQIDWPMRSLEDEPLQLFVFATVVRSTGKLVAARIWNYVIRKSVQTESARIWLRSGPTA